MVITPKERIRFLSKVSFRASGCWLWTGAKTERGYGYFRFGGRTWRAHRWAYFAFKGPVPEEIYVLHQCDVPSCVSPFHLFLGTAKDNARDCIAKGRKPSPSACPHGHKYTQENTVVRKNRAGKECRACILKRDKNRSRGGLRIKEFRARKK